MQTTLMVNEIRKNARFNKIGRAVVQDICIFQGVIINVSLDGCCIRFPVVLTPDLEKDYELHLSFSEKKAPDSLVLLGHIQWIEPTEEATEIGFSLYHSPDSKKLKSYIQKLNLEDQENVCPT